MVAWPVVGSGRKLGTAAGAVLGLELGFLFEVIVELGVFIEVVFELGLVVHVGFRIEIGLQIRCLMRCRGLTGTSVELDHGVVTAVGGLAAGERVGLFCLVFLCSAARPSAGVGLAHPGSSRRVVLLATQTLYRIVSRCNGLFRIVSSSKLAPPRAQDRGDQSAPPRGRIRCSLFGSCLQDPPRSGIGVDRRTGPRFTMGW
jgi:hypothetical protein